MAGKLYIVGTPIGNLQDITFRAVEVLKNIDFIACEDTRVSMKLLNAYGIKKPLVSYYKHKEREAAEKITALIAEGKNAALITDAGMPSISDPGAILVSECRARGIKTEAVPGPSASVTAVALAGISARGFTFLGFLPEKIKDKKEYIKDFIYSPLPLVFYSSTHDINADGRFLADALGDRKVFIVKEITKLHEGVDEQTLEDFNVENPRGEYVLIVMPSEVGSALNSLPIAEHVKHYMRSGLEKKEAVKRTAADRGVDKNTVYTAALDL